MTTRSLAATKRGVRGRIVRVLRDLTDRSERLAALGVTTGASIVVLQTFPVIVVECDQTELAIERAMAAAVLIEIDLPS
jgi:Fe2+ transport system protein FeoA